MWLVFDCCYSIMYLVPIIELSYLIPNPILGPICPIYPGGLVGLVSAFSVAVSNDITTTVVVTIASILVFFPYYYISNKAFFSISLDLYDTTKQMDMYPCYYLFVWYQ